MKSLVIADGDKGRASRNAAIGYAGKGECHTVAKLDLGGCVQLDGDALPVANNALAVVAVNDYLSGSGWLDFEHGSSPSGSVWLAGIANDQPFAAVTGDFIGSLNGPERVGFPVTNSGAMGGERQAFNRCNPLTERFAGRRIKNEKANLFPSGGLRCGNGSAKASGEQLTVQREAGQTSDEPSWSIEHNTIAADQSRPIPQGADAVDLFRSKPAINGLAEIVGWEKCSHGPFVSIPEN